MKVLIVDDEPLVQAGIKSMINWAEYNCTIIGTASNGEIAYKMIHEGKPDIVITDIKMPVMSGLELVKKCSEDGLDFPVFILLTSYEELQYYKEAIKYQVLEYLVKLELTPELLITTLKKAIDKVASMQKTQTDALTIDNTNVMRERFLTKLVLNMLDESDHLPTLFDYYKLDFSATSHIASYLKIHNTREVLDPEKQITLYTSSLQVVNELLVKYLPCDIFSLDARYFCVIFHTDDSYEEAKDKISTAIKNVSEMLFSYYGAVIVGGVGSPVSDPTRLSDSYQDAKRMISRAMFDSKVLFYIDEAPVEADKSIFNMALFRDDLKTAFTEYDSESLNLVFTELIELFKSSPSHYVQSIDAAGTILYMALSFLHNGEQVLTDIFADMPSGYRSLYESVSTNDVLSWMTQLKDGLCLYFDEHSRDFKSNVVTNVKKYIRENTTARLSLNEVAKLFNISPSYLSLLFSKYSDVGFSDYINQCKIDEAMKMLREGRLKVYEIADELGYESTSYFSRVFKKVTGLSPRDYLNQISE